MMKADAIRFRLNGVELAADVGETIIEVAQRSGIDIPHLCYTPGMRPDGNCRACMVEIKGERRQRTWKHRASASVRCTRRR